MSTAAAKMGLLKLLAFPVTGPLWIAQTVRDEAERQFYDIDRIRRQMADLDQQREQGLITPETFEGQEEELLQRLLDAHAYHRGQQEQQEEF